MCLKRDSLVTDSIGNVQIRRGSLCAPFARLLDLVHIPKTKSCSPKLTPYSAPWFIFANNATVCLALDVLDEGAREVDLVGMCRGKLDDRTNFWVKLGFLLVGGRKGRVVAEAPRAPRKSLGLLLLLSLLLLLRRNIGFIDFEFY